MSWHGKAHKGAMRDRRADKRRDAEERQARTAARRVVEEHAAKRAEQAS